MGIRSFSQNFEDVILWRVLNDVVDGFYIDIGAQHPIKDSVSKAFSQNGWRGIHVEPVPEYAEMLRADRPNDQVIQAIVSDHNGVSDFYYFEGTGLSTARKDISESHESKNFKSIFLVVPAITLDDVFSYSPNNIVHWLKIDVEGLEKQVLEGWVQSDCRPWVLVIEATMPGTQNEIFEEWQQIILNKGYIFVYSDGLNRFYVHNEKIDLCDKFKFPPNIFDGFQLFEKSEYVTELVNDYRNSEDILKNEVNSIRNALNDAVNKADVLSEQRQNERDQVYREEIEKLIQRGMQQTERSAALQAMVDELRADLAARHERDQQAMVSAREAAAQAARREAQLAERSVMLQAMVDELRADLAARHERDQQAMVSAREAATQAAQQEAQLSERSVMLQAMVDQLRQDNAAQYERDQQVRESAQETEAQAARREMQLVERSAALQAMVDQLSQNIDAKREHDQHVTESAQNAVIEAARREARLMEKSVTLQLMVENLRDDITANEQKWKKHSQLLVDDIRAEMQQELDQMADKLSTMMNENTLIVEKEKNISNALLSDLININLRSDAYIRIIFSVINSKTWKFAKIFRKFFDEESLMDDFKLGRSDDLII